MRRNAFRSLLVVLLISGMISGCSGEAPKEASPVAAPEPPAVTEHPSSTGSGPEADLPEADAPDPDEPQQEAVIPGDEQFEKYLPLLTGKRVALFSNHTGIVGDQHILDALLERDIQVTLIFSPEHGFRGTEDAGAAIDDSRDEQTGIPILSLHNDKTRHPSAESMSQFDVLVADMQDVGLRYYTYYISLYYLMNACAQAGNEVVILDRPNPNGFYTDGPILREEYRSGVGALPIPVVYGLTWGELAQMINGEGWLTAGQGSCDLTVIPCRGYTHQTKTDLNCAPSPNLKDMRAVYLYASTCFFENTVISVGRGTDFPFEIYGSPLLKDVPGNDFRFTPESMPGATAPPYEGEECFGKDLRDIPLERIFENGIDLTYLIDAYQDVQSAHPDVEFFGKPDKSGRYWIDLLFGTDEVRRMILAGNSAAEIRASWQEELAAFREQSAPYLLYP